MAPKTKPPEGWDDSAPVTAEDFDAAEPVAEPAPDYGPGDAARRTVARVGWALPGVFGLDAARANAIGNWVRSRMEGGPVVDVEKQTQDYRTADIASQTQHPWATLGAALPAEAFVQAAAAPVTAGKAILKAGPAASAAAQALYASLSSLGQTQGQTPNARALQSGLSGLFASIPGYFAPGAAASVSRTGASKELAAAQRAAGGPVTAEIMDETPEAILEAIVGKIPGVSDDATVPAAAPELAGVPSGAGRPNARPSPLPQEPPQAPPVPPVAETPPIPKVPPHGHEPQVPPEAANFVRRLLERNLFGADEVPTKEAMMLETRGVPLTMGQRTPRGPGNQIEEAATSLPMHGPVIKSQRDAAQAGWQNLVLNTARAPGTKRIPASGDRWSDLTSVYEGFNKAYSAIRDQNVLPAIGQGAESIPLQTIDGQAGAVARAVTEVEGIPPAVQDLVIKSVERQLSRLPQVQGDLQAVTAGSLMTVRRGIRDAIRGLVRAGGLEAEDRIKGYEAAERALTSALESQLEPKTAAALRAIDAQYRNYKMVERAFLYSADSPSGFSPHQLSRGVQAATDAGEFARGGGGPLRELAQAGRVVFEQQTPPTGARQIVLSGLPKMVADPLVGSAVVKANTRAAPRWTPPDWASTVDWFKP